MSNVISMPPLNVREWEVLRRQIERTLREAGQDEQMIREICQELRGPALSAFGQSITVPTGGDEALKTVNAWFSAVVTHLMMHLAIQVARNIELERALGMR